LVSGITFENHGAWSNGGDDCVRVKGELGCFADELRYS
jgi:hypothetical protein